MGHALIDKALKNCSTRYRLSKMTGITEQALGRYYSGARALTPVAAAKIAVVAGEDPRDAMAVAAIEAEEDPAEREVLRQVFFRAGAAATLLFSLLGMWPTSSDAAVAGRSTVPDGATIYIMSTVMFRDSAYKLERPKPRTAELLRTHGQGPRRGGRRRSRELCTRVGRSAVRPVD